MKKYVLNSPILTSYGVFEFRRISSIEEAKKFLSDGEFISAVGHQPTAELITALTGIQVPFNRSQIKMENGDAALVVRLTIRLPEGKILEESELRELYNQGQVELGILRKIG